MAKYRKKPVVVEADQWWPGEDTNGVVVMHEMVFGANGKYLRPANPVTYLVHTKEGFVRIDPGDWVITEVGGEREVLKPSIFEQRYEPVEDDGEVVTVSKRRLEALERLYEVAKAWRNGMIDRSHPGKTLEEQRAWHREQVRNAYALRDAVDELEAIECGDA